MASRRDELNAYTFARKRTVGAFLLPGGGGSDEDAPRPVKAVLPSIVVGVLVVTGFGIWGAFRPSAPVGWDSGKNIIQGKQSTTRYVVLLDADKKTKRLHQVLNMASAKLVLPAGAKVVVVADQVLDAYANHGPTIGIQYAPDKLPTEAVAGKQMKWSVCNSPGSDDKRETVNQAVFVAGGAEAKTLEAKGKVLDLDQSVLVQLVDDAQINGQQSAVSTQSKLAYYLIDSEGRSHAIGDTQTSDADKQAIITAVFGESAEPQRVKPDWLDTLEHGTKIHFPAVPGLDPNVKSANSSVQLQNTEDRKIGRLVKYGEKNYVVGKDELYPITNFQSALLERNPALQGLYSQDKDPRPKVDELTPAEQSKYGQGSLKDNKLSLDGDWPAKAGAPANNWNAPKEAKGVVCSTFDGVAADGKTVKRSIWVDTTYPAKYSIGAGSAHVTPGYGLFYRALDATSEGSGSDFLITETGLRYSVQSNNDAAGVRKQAQQSQQATAKASQPAAAQPDPQGADAKQAEDEAGGTQARLGYKNIQPAPVPREWSDLVPDGPVLSTDGAAQPQNA